MRFAIIENGTVANIAAASKPLAENWVEIQGQSVNIGDTYDGQGFSAPVIPLEEAKEKKREALADMVDQKLAAGFTVNGLPVDTTEKGLARLNMGKAKGRASRKIVTARGKGRAVVTDAEFQAVYDAVEAHGQAIMDNWYDILDSIDSATPEQIDAIDITQGWP